MAAGAGVGTVPAAADEGDGVAVAGVVDVAQHQLESDVGDAEADEAPELGHLSLSSQSPPVSLR